MHYLSQLAAEASIGADGATMITMEHVQEFAESVDNDADKAQLVRGVFESTAMAITHTLHHLAQLDWNCQRLVVYGPGAESELWCQIIADSCQQSVLVHQGELLAARGAAAMAAAAAVQSHSLTSCTAAITQQGRLLEPNLAYTKAYQSLTHRYENSYSELDKEESTSIFSAYVR